MRKRDRVIGNTLADPNVQVIQRTGFDPDQDFPGRKRWGRNVLTRELFRAAVSMEGDCFHGEEVRLKQEFSFGHHDGLSAYFDLLDGIVIGEHLDGNP